MKNPLRGEVWMVDLGMAAKVRPCLVLSVPLQDEDRALVTVTPHTTSLLGTRFEVPVPTRFLKPGAFDGQQLVTIARAKFIRKLGDLDSAQIGNVERVIRQWLGLDDAKPPPPPVPVPPAQSPGSPAP